MYHLKNQHLNFAVCTEILFSLGLILPNWKIKDVKMEKENFLYIGGLPMRKVAIIGGGPAGLTAAIEGAKKGFQVDLFERYKVGDDIRCAEGFFDTLNLLGEPKYGVRFKVDQLELEIKHSYTFPLDEKVNIWMIDRSEWQRGLAEEAKSLGVNVIENSPISKEKYEEIRKDYDWVIDSTGAPSVTSRVYGFSTFYKENAGITAQYTLHGDFSSWVGRLKAALEDHYDGYYWIFPKSEQEANVGIIFFTENDLNPWQELERILEKEGLSDYERTRKLGGICPVVRPKKLVYDNVLLTGDAAGLVSALHGGGIDCACISGKIAIECMEENKVDEYEKRIDEVLGGRLKGEKRLANLVWKLNRSITDRLVKAVHQSEKSLGEYGFLNGNADAFEKLGILKGLIPALLKH